MEKRIISKFTFNPWKLINEKRYVIRKEIKYLTGRERERCYVSLEYSEYFSLFTPEIWMIKYFSIFEFPEKYFSKLHRGCMKYEFAWGNKLIGKVRIGRTGSKLIQKFLEKWSMFRGCMITEQDWCTGLRLCFKTNHYNSSWFIYLSNFSFSFSYLVDIHEKRIYDSIFWNI